MSFGWTGNNQTELDSKEKDIKFFCAHVPLLPSCYSGIWASGTSQGPLSLHSLPFYQPYLVSLYLARFTSEPPCRPFTSHPFPPGSSPTKLISRSLVTLSTYKWLIWSLTSVPHSQVSALPDTVSFFLP